MPGRASFVWPVARVCGSAPGELYAGLLRCGGRRVRGPKGDAVMTESMPVPVATDYRRARLWVNWTAALLTAAGAALVMVFSMGAVMSTAACSTAECPDLGPSGVAFGVMYYGAPVIAALTILASFITAGRRRGFLVPVAGWMLLALDMLALMIAFRR